LPATAAAWRSPESDAKTAADFDPVHVGEAEVDDDQVRTLRSRDRRRFFTVGGFETSRRPGTDGIAQLGPDLRFVVDDEYRRARQGADARGRAWGGEVNDRGEVNDLTGSRPGGYRCVQKLR